MTDQPLYKEAYALVISAKNMTEEEHNSLHELIGHFLELINGFTPYEAYFDVDYSDNITPEKEEEES